jgi:hypothetical protein
MAALAHTRFAALALWYTPSEGTPRGRIYQIDLKVPRQQTSVKMML